jgi:hypothetical protein
MKRTGLVAYVMAMAAMASQGCDDSATGAAPPGTIARVYDGDFECTEIDGDTARLTWDAAAGTGGMGTFGWIPSSSGSGAFVSMPISSLKFDVVFTDVLGLDKAGVAETVRLRFDLAPSADAKRVAGPGTLTRASGTVETCNATFRERAFADAGGG